MINLLPFEKIEREVLVRKEAETSMKYGCRPEERSTAELLDYGIIDVDKPKGPTSHQVSAYVQKILGINKSGHSGTLDPNVTGVLPIALGRATRIVQTLLNAGKEYIAVMHLHKEVDGKLLKETIEKNFIGKIKQLPPIKSAIKRQWRFRKVYYIEILEIEDQDVLMRIGCQAGTYIRKLIHDIGQKLGVGAHMSELRRTKAGPFDENNLVTLQELSDAFYYHNEGNDKYIRKVVLPMEFAVKHLGKVWVLDSTVNTLCHGADLKVPGISKAETEIQADDTVAVMSLKDELVAVGKARMISREMIKEKKGIAVRIDKVFMLPETYPKVAVKKQLQ